MLKRSFLIFERACKTLVPNFTLCLFLQYNVLSQKDSVFVHCVRVRLKRHHKQLEIGRVPLHPSARCSQILPSMWRSFCDNRSPEDDIVTMQAVSLIVLLDPLILLLIAVSSCSIGDMRDHEPNIISSSPILGWIVSVDDEESQPH